MRDAVILIPSYEPDDELIRVVQNIHEQGFNVLVVNDGSKKEYDDVFLKVQEYAKYESYEKNMGKGFAMKHGFKKIKSLFPEVRFVITVDGDGQHSLEDIIRVYEELNRSDELVFGSRTFDRNTPFKSKFGNDWSKLSRSLVTKKYVNDDQCGLRGFPVRYLDELARIPGNRYEYEMNQITIFQLKHYPVRYINIKTIYIEGNAKTHFSPFIDTCRIQGIIFIHSFPALVSNSLLIFLLIFLANKDFNLALNITISYFSSLIAYLILSFILYPSKRILDRLKTEGLFMIIKFALAMGLLYLFVELFDLPIYVFGPIVVILLLFINFPLSYIIFKIKQK